MADKKQDVPEKNGQTILGGEKTAPDTTEKSPDHQAPPVPEDKSPAPSTGGKEDKVAPAGPGRQTPP